MKKEEFLEQYFDTTICAILGYPTPKKEVRQRIMNSIRDEVLEKIPDDHKISGDVIKAIRDVVIDRLSHPKSGPVVAEWEALKGMKYGAAASRLTTSGYNVTEVRNSGKNTEITFSNDKSQMIIIIDGMNIVSEIIYG